MLPGLSDELKKGPVSYLILLRRLLLETSYQLPFSDSFNSTSSKDRELKWI